MVSAVQQPVLRQAVGRLHIALAGAVYDGAKISPLDLGLHLLLPLGVCVAGRLSA